MKWVRWRRSWVENMSTSSNFNFTTNELTTKGIVCLENQSFNDQELLELAHTLSSRKDKALLEWDFGPIMEMKFSASAKNYLFSEEEVPFHWDGAFLKEPKYLIFFCTESSGGAGGEGMFCDTRGVYHALSGDEKKQLQKLKLEYKTEKLAHYGGSIEVPVLQNHPDTGEKILRFALPVQSKKNPVTRTILSGNENLCLRIEELLRDENHIYQHTWKKGDLLIVDNFSYIHGRHSLGENLRRSFKRVQVL